MKIPRALLVVAIVVALGAVLALRLTATSRGVAAAQRALDAHDLPAAEAAWRDVLAADPSRADALYGLGWTLHLAGKPELARDAFQQCVEAHPESPLGYKGLGSVAMAAGNPALARQQFEQALQRAPNDPAIRHSLGLLALASGHADDAIAAFQALAAEEPERAAFRQALAEALLAGGREQDALDAATEAVRLAGDDGQALALGELTRARALLAVCARRVDTEDCAGTAPPVYAWLAEADRALDHAEAVGIPLPDLVEARRAVHTRRGSLDDTCPGVRSGLAPGDGLGRKYPGG